MQNESRDRGGIHHITMIASDAQANVDFYAGVLGMRLTKRTVNFDDPGAYHLYYGDGAGSVGSALTFFPYPHGRKGVPGRGQVSELQLAIEPGAASFWHQRLERFAIPYSTESVFGFGDELAFSDPDGLALRLIEAEAMAVWEWPNMVLEPRYVIRKSVGVSISTRHPLAGETDNPTRRILTDVLGFQGDAMLVASDGTWVHLLDGTGLPSGNGGAGGVHHVAYRASDDAVQSEIHGQLYERGVNVSHVYERDYFRSIYFREPGGVLFEVATDGPGFLIDESFEELGTSLRLPANYEPYRSQIEANLPALTFDPADWR